MATFKGTLKTAQDYTNIGSRPSADKRLFVARGSYTLLGTETATDVIKLVTLPAGAEVVPQLSYFACDATVGSALVVTIGTDLDVDAYSTVTTLTSGGLVNFAAGTNGVEFVSPVAKTVSYDVQLTVSTATSLTEGKKLSYNIAYLA